MSRTIGIVHDSRPVGAGEAHLHVGFCTVYDGGPQVLLTLEGRTDRRGLVEVALQPESAEELAKKLIEMAREMRRSRREPCPAA